MKALVFVILLMVFVFVLRQVWVCGAVPLPAAVTLGCDSSVGYLHVSHGLTLPNCSLSV